MKISTEKVREATQYVRAMGETTIANYAAAKNISAAYASTILKTTHDKGLIGLDKPAKQAFGEKREPYRYFKTVNVPSAGVEKDPTQDDPYEPVLPVTVKRKRPVRNARAKVNDFLATKKIGYRFDVLRVQRACNVSHQPVREALKPLTENGIVIKDGFKSGRQQYRLVGSLVAPVAAPVTDTTVAGMTPEQLVAREASIEPQIETLLAERADIKTRLAAIRAIVLPF